MKILVGVKRVIDYAIKIRVANDGKGVEINNVKHSLNPFCEIALEEAVKIKEAKIAKEVVALSIGSKLAQESLRTALAIGADKAIHIETDLRIDQQIQPLIVAKIFEKIVKRDNYDLVLLGKQAIDDDCNQTGQILAGILGWPQATFASKVIIQGKNVEVNREIDGGIQTIQFQLPGIITTDLRLNTPRFASLPNIMKAKKKPIENIKLDSLDIDFKSKLEVLKVENPVTRKGGAKVQSVDELIDKLRNEAKLF